MIGTIINFFAIIGGSFLGIIAKKGISKQVQQAVFKIQGVAVLIIGLNGVICSMITYDVDKKALTPDGSILLLVSLVIGAVIGEILKIEDRFEGLGKKIQGKIGASTFSEGFVTASILFCVGGMAIIGAINDSMGDSSLLIIKSTLDMVASIILASSLGIGVMFSCVSVALYQGLISLFSSYIQVFFSQSVINDISMVGYAIIICIGLNFAVGTKIKTSNLFPALLIPIVYNFTMLLKTL